MRPATCPPSWAMLVDGGHGARAPLPTLRLAHPTKLLRHAVQHEQRAFGDAEIGAVQIEPALLDLRLDEWKRHQVFEAAEYRGLLDAGGEILHGLVLALLDLLAGFDE